MFWGVPSRIRSKKLILWSPYLWKLLGVWRAVALGFRRYRALDQCWGLRVLGFGGLRFRVCSMGFGGC